MAISLATYEAQAVLVDDFNRANENPLTGWTIGFNGGTAGFQIISNQATRQGAGFGNVYRTSVFSGADQVSFYTLSVAGDVSLYIRAKQFGSGTFDAYSLFHDNTAHTLEFAWTNNSSYARIGSAVSYTASASDILGIAAVGSEFALGYKRSGAWTNLIQTTDSTYAGASGDGLALEGSGTTFRIDDVYAGTISAAAGGLVLPRRNSMRLNPLLRR